MARQEIVAYLTLVRNADRFTLLEWMQRMKGLDPDEVNPAVDSLLSDGTIRAEPREVEMRLNDPELTDEQREAVVAYEKERKKRLAASKKAETDESEESDEAAEIVSEMERLRRPTRTIEQLFIQ